VSAIRLETSTAGGQLSRTAVVMERSGGGKALMKEYVEGCWRRVVCHMSRDT
jgi:hypothetical protein